MSPINQDDSFGHLVVVYDGPLGDIGALVGVGDVIEQLVASDIQKLGALYCFQFIGAAIQDAFLNEGDHDGECLALVSVVSAVEAFFGGAEYFGEADHIAAEVVHEHVVGVALLTDGSVVVLVAAQDVDVAFTFEEVVVLPTFEAAPPVAVSLYALAQF